MDNTPRISVVDDDPSARNVLNRLFKSVGYRVNLYDTSESFLAAGVADETDCLILDVHLPGKSGIELQRELMLSEKHCPIVFISAFDDEPTRARALKDGAIDFLGKPLDIGNLLEVIDRIVAKNT